MAWDEWEQLKSEAAERASGNMQLNRLPDDMGGGSGRPPSSAGDLEVHQKDLVAIGKEAHTLYDQLWDKARLKEAVDGAAGDLTTQGFALGSGLSHVSTKWSTQLNSLLDACAHISNHLQVTRRIHDDDENYILRQMSSITALDAGFDERVEPHEAPKPNPIYGDDKKK
ncbi:hypothetical protein [Streptomyces sp. UH6]|uniref:hypothetical protein n=1 Tax=Streptomyces sp. UH6 TaxID=2748379 RepID=UPI0015D4A273|nr:hypothetical protein [Streptomyces sp. UH6]NYV74306.1 hypothetical protein [Streptomyces sp. UH6]